MGLKSMTRSQEIIFSASPLVISVIILGGGSQLASLICAALMLACLPMNRGYQWSVPVYFKWAWITLILYLVILSSAPEMVRQKISPQIGEIQSALWPVHWLPLSSTDNPCDHTALDSGCYSMDLGAAS